MEGQERRAGVIDDGGHLRRRQSPVDSDVDGTHERATEEKVEIRNTVAVEKGEAVSGTKAVALRRLCDTTRDVELLRPGSALGTLDQHLVVWPVTRQVAKQPGHRIAVLLGDDDARCQE